MHLNKQIHVCISAFIVGTADLLAAFLNAFITKGIYPKVVLQYIASGIFGKEAFSGKASMLFSGLLLHFIIAYLFTLLFFLVFPRLTKIIRYKVAIGLIYGVFIWIVMNLMVLPLSKVGDTDLNLTNIIRGILILVFAIGLPLVYLTDPYFVSKPTYKKS